MSFVALGSPLSCWLVLLSVVALFANAAAAKRTLAGGSSTRSAAPTMPTLHACNFEEPCAWNFKKLRIVTGQEMNNTWVSKATQPPGPFVDANNNTRGHFLHTYVKKMAQAGEVQVLSPRFQRSSETCKLHFFMHLSNMQKGTIKVIVEATNSTKWEIKSKSGNNINAWIEQTFSVGRISQEFNVVIEIIPGNNYPYHIALDNVLLRNCFPGEKNPSQSICNAAQFQCSNGSCIDIMKICNINIDCPNGEDETQEECFKVPEFARCTFEDGWCGWQNSKDNVIKWSAQTGSSTSYYGPSYDHTYHNSSGTYMNVNMTGRRHDMGTPSDLESPIINPPPRYHSNASSPYYNSCYITFHYRRRGQHSVSLGLFLNELQSNNNVTSRIWWSYEKGDKWQMQTVILPNITHRYFLQFEARKSFATFGDSSLDDISMSPKCFGSGVPPAHLDGYVYENSASAVDLTPPPSPHPDFSNITYYKFTTCGQTGRYGPTPDKCENAYNNTATDVTVITEGKTEKGIQKWTVPETGYYTIFARGASGGYGSDGKGSSLAAIVRGVVELKKGQQLYILVGQEGMEACKKMSFKKSDEERTKCEEEKELRKTSQKVTSKLHKIHKLSSLPEGGGGGGGTFIFLWPKNKAKQALIVAGGGGGLSHGSNLKDTIHHGKDINNTLPPITGDAYGNVPAGAGGGWEGGNLTYRDVTGVALLQGGVGGKACYVSSDGTPKGAGGFGGGGGGCTAGGGGGGYTGGRAWDEKSGLGEGGYSWAAVGVVLPKVWVSPVHGPGEVMIIPALPSPSCGCDYRCVTVDLHRHLTRCLCPESWQLANDSLSCLLLAGHQEEWWAPFMSWGVLLLFIVILGSIGLIGASKCYNRYLKSRALSMRRKMANGPDLQLNRLRAVSDSMVTEYNPNYEFGGGIYSLRDLKEVPREHLRLVKALGQGAFGEVYQGFFKHRAGDTVEMPVAVKTLPELSTNQNETDFLMEALIMSKFNHPNIVHFIGVCFDKHPRFIVIELLAGGDLKTFLRESRPKMDRASPLTMKDLVTCIVDVSKGCKYMEENRFIHRDIAARNCLLTTKGPGRVVKIADFGMARDIYRADYYRKGGKAMLPIKWMPPEAFLDGIFTSKTDVWSFGVLMWEVMSLGYMPYTGCANREVMNLVTSGGRLEKPTNCPEQLYAIMTQCWHPTPDERPSFSLIYERLGYCMQDPDVMKAPLPKYSTLAGVDGGRDLSVIRGGSGATCGRIIGSSSASRDDIHQPSDYLVPLPGDVQIGGAAAISHQSPHSWPETPYPTTPQSRLTPPPLSTTKHQGGENAVFTVSHNIKQDTAEITC